MKPSTELFKLIKSLSKSEKRFFKLSSSLQSGDKNYLKVFDYIEQQNEYDEEEMKKSFKKETFIKHLPSEKNHLYKLILKSLRSYYSEQSVSSILKQEIKNIEILYNKALYKECEKFVSRAKKIATENEKFYYWFELLSWEKKLIEEAFEEGIFNNNLDELIKEEEMVIAKLRNLAEYQVIYSKINLIFRSGGFTRSEEEQEIVEGIADYHLIKGKNTALSTRSATMCYYIKGLCAATNRNFDDSFQFFNRTREILDNNPKIKANLGQRYLLTLAHLLRCYIESKDFVKAADLIADIRNLESKPGFNSIDIKVRVFTISYIYELVLLQRQGLFQESIKVIEKVEELHPEYEGKISKEQEVLFKYHKAISYFGVGDFKAALSYINDVLNDNEQNLRQDIYSFARIFNLVVHFELENYDFLDYVIKSTNRYLNKQSRAFDAEGVVIKHIRKMAKVMSNTEKIEVVSSLKSELIELMEQDPHEKVLLEYFDVFAWIASKLNKSAFDQEVIAQLKSN